MPIFGPPNQCIWCRADTTLCSTNISHVLPECLGNAKQQILPAGIVCKSCNSYFGKEIEPFFVRDPLIHVIAAFLQVVDPGDQQLFREKVFDREHEPASGIRRNLGLELKLRGNRIELDVTTSLSGTVVQEYSHRDLRFLSRAIHKIAFESLAWQVYVANAQLPAAQDIRRFDPLSSSFDSVRRWGREGQPMNRVRPVFRKPASTITRDWNVRLWAYPEGLGCELNLFADWYGVSLTSPPELAEGHLRQWTAGLSGSRWMISDNVTVVDIPRSDVKANEMVKTEPSRSHLTSKPRRWLYRAWKWCSRKSGAH